VSNAPAPKPRAMKPRQPVAVAAVYVSQLTCLPLLGVDARRFLDVLVPKCAGDVVAIGRLRLVPLDVAVSRLRELAAESNEHDDQADDKHEELGLPTTAAGVFAALGRRSA
jgi:hypothetical protein